MFVDITTLGDKVDWLLLPNLPERRWMFQGGLQELLATGIMVAGPGKEYVVSGCYSVNCAEGAGTHGMASFIDKDDHRIGSLCCADAALLTSGR